MSGYARNAPVDMRAALYNHQAESVPRPLSSHRGYGAGAVEAADERLVEEVRARRAARATASAAATTTKQPQPPQDSVAAIEAKLGDARKQRAAAKRQYERALALEKKLEREHAKAVEREKKRKEVETEKREKARRRERALGIKAPTAARPEGIRKATVPAKGGAVRRAATERKTAGLSASFLEE
ncbi:hypothetical protein BU26DRAFT_500769 [Trematosphaeria pertusa]|uniref:Uncharacterized protein n=1 Tax=Trematosphaeria pertusa TaxID=390896 RepID=A0A6A6IXD2_9PLEO|nr:uncharacterized protein BU26DRAFT_500769 [Trematosphaeria pertusa]KAF2255149.1 hypothetical protein BU26DRAFT_500769 [Trematosphaeria pertusa]